MKGKLIAACISVVAFAAFGIAPTMASASPVLTDTVSGVVKTVEVGKKISAINSEPIVLSTGLGNVTCSFSELTASVHTNSGTLIKATIEKAVYTGTGSEGRCTSTLPFNPQFVVDVENLHYCIESEPTDKFIVRGGGCTEGAKNLRFTLTNALLGSCTYEKASVTGSHTTGGDPAPASLTLTEQEFTKVAGGSSCPASGKLKGAYRLYTDTATEAQSTEDPVWIS